MPVIIVEFAQPYYCQTTKLQPNHKPYNLQKIRFNDLDEKPYPPIT